MPAARFLILTTLAVTILTSSGLAQPAGKPDVKPPAAPAPAPASAQPTEVKNAEDLLASLETADKNLRTLSAKMMYITVASDLEANDRQTRIGTLYFRNKTEPKTPDAKPAPDSQRAACIKFDTLRLEGSKEQRPEHKTYIIDGVTMIEKIDDEKLMNRYRIGEPGKPQDPLKLGEGPFPVPFGQKKEDVQARFTAELVPSADSLPKDVQPQFAQTYQLKLIPKPGAGVSKNVKELRVWYLKKDLVPTLARIVKSDGGSEEIFLIAPKVNETLPTGIFDSKPPEGWKVEDKERP